MRRRRKLFYEITTYSSDPRLSFYTPQKKWFDDDNPPENWKWQSTHQNCIFTAKKAFRIANGIKNRWPNAEVIVLRWFYKNGQRALQEWEIP